MSRQTNAITSVASGNGLNTTRDVVCGKCEHANPTGSRFCADCGASLWERCLSCGAECTTSEKFCGSCGTNLREFIETQINQAEVALATAEELVAAYRIDDAIRVLKKAQVSDDSRLEDIAKRIRDRTQSLQERSERESQGVETGIKRIRELIDSHAYLDAIKLLQKLPEPYQTDETKDLLASALSKEKEIRQLKAEIKESFEKKQILDLAPKFQRLLTLRPDSESTIKLAGKVRDTLLKAAQKRLMSFEYKQARDLVSRVPACAVDKNTEELGSRASEFLWLVDDLHDAPIVDQPLLDIAKRFAKKAPGDKSNTVQCSKLFALDTEEKKSKSLRFPGVPWGPVPKRTHVGCPVDWLGGSERLHFSDEAVLESWNSEPGSYFVAAGLAIQGLGRSQLDTNLHKAEKRGLLGPLSLGKRKETVKTAWGLDIGDASIKVLRMVSSSDDTDPTVDCCDILQFPVPLSRPEAEAKHQAILSEALEQLLSKYTIEKTDHVCVSFPGHKVLSRSLTLPKAAPKKQLEMVKFEAKQQMPIPLDELAWSFQSFADDESSKDSQDQNTILVAAKLRDVNELLLCLKEAEIPVQVLQSDAIALCNFAMFEGLADIDRVNDDSPGAIALVDVGSWATNIVIISDKLPWFRNIRRGGDSFTEAAARHMHLTKDQAEQAKKSPTQVRRISELYESFDPIFAQLTDEVQRSFQSFKKDRQQEVSHILGVGGGFRLHGLLRYLRSGP